MPSGEEGAPEVKGAVVTASEGETVEPTRGADLKQPGMPRRRVRRWLARRHELVKDYVQVVALLLAASWAIWVFLYENVYKPAREEPNVVVSTSLEEGGRGKGLIAVKARATAKNLGRRDANILGAWFNVEGYTLTREDGPAAEGYRDAVLTQLRRRTPAGVEIDMHASRYSDYDEDNERNRKYIFSTNFLLNHSTLRPDEEDAKVVTFHVPENEFDLVRVILHVIYDVDDRFVRREWAAGDDGQLRLVAYIRECETCAEEEYNPAVERHRRLRKKYGLTHTQSVIDLPLWDKAATPPNRQSDSDRLIPEAVAVERK